MSKLTIKITKVPRGAYVKMGSLSGLAEIARRMDGSEGLCLEGDILLGCDYKEHDAEYRAAIMATIADGQARTLSYGEDKDNAAEIAAYDAGHKAVEDAMTLGGRTY